ncbi:MAG: hypothetical protein ACLFRU_07730, partial [Paracoccaceae bacterium]
AAWGPHAARGLPRQSAVTGGGAAARGGKTLPPRAAALGRFPPIRRSGIRGPKRAAARRR